MNTHMPEIRARYPYSHCHAKRHFNDFSLNPPIHLWKRYTFNTKNLPEAQTLE